MLLLLLAPLGASARHHPRHPSQAASFDYYLLSLSIAPSCCALSDANRAKQECRSLDDAAYRRMPLTVHGLWPNRAGVSANRQPQDCPAPPLTLSAGLQSELDQVMPGGIGLERHEWRRHGSCSGLDPEAYFSTLVRLAHAADRQIGSVLREGGWLGGELRIAALREAVSAQGRRAQGGAQGGALASALVVTCRFPRGGGRALVTEIRVVLSRDLAPLPADQVGLGQNSGCPAGRGLLPG